MKPYETVVLQITAHVDVIKELEFISFSLGEEEIGETFAKAFNLYITLWKMRE